MLQNTPLRPCLRIKAKNQNKKKKNENKNLDILRIEIVISSLLEHYLIQNVKNCIIDGMKKMFQYSYTYSFNITSRSTEVCAGLL